MKSSYARYYRRNASSLRAPATNTKDSQKEPAFFAGPTEQRFFKPSAAIRRKCDHCEADEKAQRMAGPKEDEKKAQRMPEKKEETVQKKEEKELYRNAEKKEEPELHRATDKKEEKELQRTMDKKEDEKINRAPEHKEEEVHRATDDKDKELHRKTDMSEDKKTVAKKESANTSDGSINATPSYIKTLNGKGQALPEEAQSFFGKRMGYNFSHVKIHTGSEAEQSARDVNAKAYAVDNNIVFNKGQYDTSSPQGKTLLAHELTHVVQQDGHGSDMLSRVADNMDSLQAHTAVSFIMGGHANAEQNKRAYVCEGLDVEGHTDANYTNTFKASGNTKASTKCADCDLSDCIDVVGGNIVSSFKANPVITLPTVPDGLSDCETAAVTKFINGTLIHHEQEHVKAFNTYNATINAPYKFTGCKADLEAYVHSLHDAINDNKIAAANAKSDALDPFNAAIPCDCN